MGAIIQIEMCERGGIHLTKPRCGGGDMSPALDWPYFPDRDSWRVRDIVYHPSCMIAEYKRKWMDRVLT